LEKVKAAHPAFICMAARFCRVVLDESFSSRKATARHWSTRELQDGVAIRRHAGAESPSGTGHGRCATASGLDVISINLSGAIHVQQRVDAFDAMLADQ